MKTKRLEDFGAYQKALQLFELVVRDFGPLARDVRCSRLVSQQFASADSVCANIEEGYGRVTKKEFIQFLIYSRGSAWETRGRYGRMHFCLSLDATAAGANLCGEIIAILTATIRTLRA